LEYISRLAAAGLILQDISTNDAIMVGSNKTFQMMAEPTSAQSSTEDLRQRNVNREKTIGGTGDYSRDGENSGSGQDRLDRYLSSKPIVAFGLTLQASWEAIAISFQSVLVNGGPSTLVYGMILSIFGSTAMAATLAELASMKPCVGAQYRWTAMLAPRGTDPRFWGFIQGYLTVFAWNFACALNPFLMGGMIQGCITLCDSSYVPQGWHTMLLSWASMALPIFCNVYARRILAPIEIAAAILHVLGFIVFVVVLVVMARRSTTDFVFETAFYGQSGWENKGVQWSIGLLAVIFPIGGYDSILHMADEVKDAPRKIPLAMVWATITSGIIGFAFIIVLLFCLGYVAPASQTPTAC
jgi:choline transport protein